MNKVETTDDIVARDFELDDIDGRPIRLTDYRGHKHVVLVFNRGLM